MSSKWTPVRQTRQTGNKIIGARGSLRRVAQSFPIELICRAPRESRYGPLRCQQVFLFAPNFGISNNRIDDKYTTRLSSRARPRFRIGGAAVDAADFGRRFSLEREIEGRRGTRMDANTLA